MTTSGALTVDPSNAAQLASWNGEQGAFWTERADRFDAGAARYRPHLLDAAALESGSRVLDVGCGSGAVTREAARRSPDGSAMGVDLSSRQLDLARDRAARDGLSNVTFVHADVQVHPFADSSVDVVLSRHGTMFFGDPVAAFMNLTQALAPGGRMALVTWQPFARNEWISTFRTIFSAGRDLPTPSATSPGAFSLSDPDHVHGLLSAAGLIDVELTDVHEPMYFGSDVEDAAGFVEQKFADVTAGLDSPALARALGELRESLIDHRTADGVCYDSAAWVVRARKF